MWGGPSERGRGVRGASKHALRHRLLTTHSSAHAHIPSILRFIYIVRPLIITVWHEQWIQLLAFDVTSVA
jgi:hypothetical protein